MIVVDTGVLYAAADRSDPDHARSAEILTANAGQLLVPTPVVVESSWLIGDRLGARSEAGFLRSMADGDLRREDLHEADWHRAIELVETYADLGLGLVDASVVAVAERVRISTVATLNHRDFRVVRPRHVDAFELVP